MLKKNVKYFIRKIERFLKSVYLWDTTVSVYLFLSVFSKKIVNFDMDQRAAAVSFSFILAVFPAIIFLFTLIPYVPINNLDDMIMVFLQDILPSGIYKTAASTIEDIVSRRRVDVLSFGFVFALFAATNGMMALMRAFNMALQQKEKRSYFKARWIALLLTFLLVFVLFSAIVVLIIGTFIINFLNENGILEGEINIYLLEIIRYLSIFLIFFLGICIIYYIAPAISKKLKFFNIGAIFASIMSILITNLFSYYLVNFNSYNRLYGSIGTLIGLMVWIYLIALILILGFEINISFRIALSMNQNEKTPQQSGAGGVYNKP